MESKQESLLLTLKEAAALLSVSRQTLVKMAKAGVLEQVHLVPGNRKSVRYRRSDVEALAGGK